MTFDRLHADTDCDCLGDTFEDVEKLFARRISKPIMRPSDFYSHWDRNKKPQSMTCNDICMFKGVSINEWNSETESNVIEKYLDSLRLKDLNTKIRDSVLIFKFKGSSGVLKYSPSKKDPSHYTFYKTDSFSVEDIEIIDTIELRNYV